MKMVLASNATTTSKGQVTIPKEIRDRLGIEEGTKLEFVLEDNGTLTVHPKDPPTERLRSVREPLADRPEPLHRRILRTHRQRSVVLDNELEFGSLLDVQSVAYLFRYRHLPLARRRGVAGEHHFRYMILTFLPVNLFLTTPRTQAAPASRNR